MKVNIEVILSFIVFNIFAPNSLSSTNDSKVVSKDMKGFVCPKLHGAMGDGIHDVNEAMQMVLDNTTWRDKSEVRQDRDRRISRNFKIVDLRIGDADVPINHNYYSSTRVCVFAV